MPQQKIVYKNNFSLFTALGLIFIVLKLVGTITWRWGWALGLIFIVLKLVGTITWSWWWVLAPFWVPLAVVLGIAVFAFSLAFIVQCFK